MANELRENIYINGTALPKPPEFTLEREDIYEGEYVSMTGKQLGDKVGWRYANNKLKWDALPQSAIDFLVSLSGAFTLGFHDENNTFIEEQVIRVSAVSLPLRYPQRGEYWWKDTEVEVRFINAHNS